MSLNNFANLKAAVIRFSHRNDLSDVIGDIVKLAENRIDNRLRITANNERATASASTSDRFLALPNRFLEMRRFNLIKDSFYYELSYLSPESMHIYGQAGIPRYYTVTSQIEFDRTPADTYSLEMSYWQKLNPLSDSNTTNNVLTNFPQIYLQACLAELHFNYTQNNEEAAKHLQQFNFLVDEANAEDLRGRYGPAPVMRPERAAP